ncbi:transmembrane protein 272-like [Mantella aurantiaca]
MFRCRNTACTTCVYFQITGLIIWGGIGVVMIIMGGLYKDDCPIQPYIPVFLMATGVAQIIVSAILLLRVLHQFYCTALDTAMFLVTFVWFIAGIFWVFSMFDQKDGKCARSLYLFAYGIMTFEWIILWVTCIYYYCYSNPKSKYNLKSSSTCNSLFISSAVPHRLINFKVKEYLQG